MLDQFLKIAGVKTQKEFYNKYPSEDAFFKAHPEAQHLKTMARGGSASSAHQQQVAQLIQAYAQAQGINPKQIMQQLQQMPPQQQQQALQQMAQAVQGGGAQPQQGMAPGYGSGAMPMAMYGMAVGGSKEKPMGPFEQRNPNAGTPDYGTYQADQQRATQQIQQQANAASAPQHGQRRVLGTDANPQDPENYDASTGQWISDAEWQSKYPNKSAATPNAPLYNGNSIVDLLAGQNKAFDMSSRKKLAASLGINNYRGTADQNHDLIQMLNSNPKALENVGSETTQVKSKKAPIIQKDVDFSVAPKTMGEAALRAGHKPDYYGLPDHPYDKEYVSYINEYMSRPWLERSFGNPDDTDFNLMIRRPYNFNNRYQYGNIDGPILGHQFVRSEYLGHEFKNTPEGDKRAKESKDKLKDHDRKVGIIGNWLGFEQGGAYGNVPQHAHPGVYSDGYSGTSSNGQYFDLGGFFNSRNPFGDIGEGMRDGSLVQAAAGVLPMAGMENKWAYKNGKNLQTDLTKYLSSNPNATKEDIQKMLSGYAEGGMAAPGYVPEYGSQAYAPSFAFGGVPLPQYRTAGLYYPDGGEVSPEEQAAMAQQQGQPDQGQQQAPEQQSGGQDQQQIVQAIAQMLQQGMQPQDILQKLVQMGVPQEQAQQLVQAVMQQMQGGQQQGPQEEQAEGAQGQEPPQQEAAEGQPMGMYGGTFAYGGVNNLSRFVGQTQEPDLAYLHNSYQKARGGMVGQEMEVTPAEMEQLRKQGYKFDLI